MPPQRRSAAAGRASQGSVVDGYDLLPGAHLGFGGFASGEGRQATVAAGGLVASTAAVVPGISAGVVVMPSYTHGEDQPSVIGTIFMRSSGTAGSFSSEAVGLSRTQANAQRLVVSANFFEVAATASSHGNGVAIAYGMRGESASAATAISCFIGAISYSA